MNTEILDQIIQKLKAEPDANLAYNVLNQSVVRMRGLGMNESAEYLEKQIVPLAEKASRAGQNIRGATLLINTLIRNEVEQRRQDESVKE